MRYFVQFEIYWDHLGPDTQEGGIVIQKYFSSFVPDVMKKVYLKKLPPNYLFVCRVKFDSEEGSNLPGRV